MFLTVRLQNKRFARFVSDAQLAAPGRGRGLETHRRPAQHRRFREAARHQPVGLHDTRGTGPHKPAPAVAPASNPAELARQVKALVGLYGADAVKGMADVFAE
jgi:hypothetical protein